jgi:hypothetical protein
MVVMCVDQRQYLFPLALALFPHPSTKGATSHPYSVVNSRLPRIVKSISVMKFKVKKTSDSGDHSMR